jgi:hypothetical protein
MGRLIQDESPCSLINLITPPAELVAFVLSALCYVLGMKKAIIFILVLTVLAILLVVLQSQTPTSLLTPETATSTETASSTNNELLRYEAEEFGFGFDYPAGWEVEQNNRCDSDAATGCVNSIIVLKPIKETSSGLIILQVMNDKTTVRGMVHTYSAAMRVENVAQSAEKGGAEVVFSGVGPIDFVSEVSDCRRTSAEKKDLCVNPSFCSMCAKQTHNDIDMLTTRYDSQPEYVMAYDFFIPQAKVGVVIYTTGKLGEFSPILDSIAQSITLSS